jgi:hypothetical protein
MSSCANSWSRAFVQAYDIYYMHLPQIIIYDITSIHVSVRRGSSSYTFKQDSGFCRWPWPWTPSFKALLTRKHVEGDQDI